MLLSTKRTKTNLVRTVLASSILISSMVYMNAAQAALTAVGGGPTDAVSPNDGYEFDVVNGILNVPNGINIGITVADSIDDPTGVAGTTTVNFLGSSAVAGEIGRTTAIDAINFDGVTGSLVTVTGASKINTVNFSNGGQVKFVGVATVQGTTTAADAGSATYAGDSVLTGDVNIDGGFQLIFNGGITFASDVSLTSGSILTINTGGGHALAGSLKIADTSQANFNDSYKVTTNLAMTGGTLTGSVGNDLDIGGTATLDGTASATLFQGTTTGVMTLNNKSTINFSGGTYIADGGITLNNNAVLTGITGAGNLVKTGAAAFAINGDAVANLYLGTAGGTMDLTKQGKVVFNDNYTVTGNLTLNDTPTVQVASGKTVTLSADLTDAGGGSRLIFDLGNTATAGTITAAAGATVINNTQTVVVQNTNLADFALGVNAPKVLVTGAAGGVITDPTLVSPSNLFANYTLTRTAATNLNLVVTRTTPTGLDSNIQGVATILGGVTSANGAGGLAALVDGLGDFSDVEAQKEALASVVPLIDGGLAQTVLLSQNTTFDLFSQRIGNLHAGLGNYHTGYAAGHTDEQGHGTWVKIFGSHADQKKRNNIAGYKAETWGIAAGADMMITERHLVGVGLSWASSDVNHKLNSGSTDVNSYQASLYGSWNIPSPLYLNWMASAAYNKYDSTRHITAGTFNQTALGNFHGWQYGARGELGYVYGENDFHITPNLALTFAHVDFSNYLEKGSSTANQRVSYQELNALTLGAGVEFSYDYEWEKSLVSPEVHANVSYDFIGDKQVSQSQFVSFGNVYESVGFSPARTDYNVGFSLTTYGKSGLGLGVSYDFNWKTNYHANSGFIRVRYEW